jgi:hypothetical protein
MAEIWIWMTSHILEGLLLQLTIWTNKNVTKLLNKMDENQLWDLHENCKEAEKNKSVMFVMEKKRCFYSMMTPHHTLMLPLQQQGEHQIWSCSTPSRQPGFGTIRLWLFAALKTLLKGIPSYVVKNWFQEQPEEFYIDGFEKCVQQ